MRPILFRCRCGSPVPSGLVDPTPRDPRAVPRRPNVRVERRCPGCGTTAEYSTAAALAPAV